MVLVGDAGLILEAGNETSKFRGERGPTRECLSTGTALLCL